MYRKAYLSEELSKLNAHVDNLYERRWGPRQYQRTAAIPRPCSRWIPNLPINIYDKHELARLSSERRMRVQVGLKSHPLTFHCEDS